MTNQQKIALLKARLQLLRENDNDTAGVCRKIEREIRDLEKK